MNHIEAKERGMRMPEQIKLAELEPGMLFKKGDTYAMKSEYRTDKGICESYIIGSGEMFWGGTGNPNALKVEPIDLEQIIVRLSVLENELRSANKQIHELETFKNHAEFLLSERQFDFLEEETEKHLELERNEQ